MDDIITNIRYRSTVIGNIRFSPPHNIAFQKSAHELSINLPAKIEFEVLQVPDGSRYATTKIFGRAEYSFGNKRLLFGRIECERIYSGGPWKTPMDCEIKLITSRAALVEIEEQRKEQPLFFHLALQVEAVIGVYDTTHHWAYATLPEQTGDWLSIPIAREPWLNFLNAINLHQYNLIEVDFKIFEAFPEVLPCIKKALYELNMGGEKHYESSLVEIRKTIELLEKRGVLEKELPGDFRQDTRSKIERIRSLAWMLKKICSPAAHSNGETWKRSDALLAINGLALIVNCIYDNGL